MHSCLIIDADPSAREALRQYIGQTPLLTAAGECSDGLEAFQWLRRHQADVVFLDVHLPLLSGTDLIRSLPEPPAVIFTTTCRESAVEAFELRALDYLLKPLSFERFLRAVARLGMASPAPEYEEALYFRVNRRMVRILPSRIQFIESLKDYVRVMTDDGPIITKQTLQSVEARLPPGHFLRIHRSFLVSSARVGGFSAAYVDVQGRQLPIGKLYKHDVERTLRTRISAVPSRYPA